MIPEEKNLTPAEVKVLAAFRAGDAAVDVEIAEIPGGFLRGLFLGRYDPDKANYSGTAIVGATISDVLDMEFCEIKFPVRFHGCSFAREIKLQQLACPELDFRGCALKGGLDALEAKVVGGVNLTKVNANGRVRLAGADIRGQLDCTGGSFQNEEGYALNAQNIKVTDAMFLREQKTKLVDGVVLHDRFRAVGTVSLAGAEIGGQLNCAGGSFQNEGKIALNARSIKAASEVIICNFSANGQVLFSNATIGGNLELNNCRLTHLSLAGANVSGELQDDAEAYKDEQGSNIDLDIDGFRYQRLKIAGADADSKRAAVKKRIEWAGLMSRGGDFFPQPYEQLMKVFRTAGHMNWARDAGFALEKKRQQTMKSRLWKVWYWILRLTIGYGYRPFRFLWWFFGIIFLGGVLFSGLPCGVSLEKTFSLWKGVSVETGKNHWNQCESLRMHRTHPVVYLEGGEKTGGEERPGNYPQFIPLLYAAETAFPLFPLGQTDNWHPATWWVKFIQWFITLLGTVALAILVLYGAGLLGPRWREE